MFLWFHKIFGKSSEIFGSVRKSSESFGKLRKRFKSNFQTFVQFFKIFGKSSEVFGNLRKISGRDRKCLKWFAGVEEFRSWLLRSPQMDPGRLFRASNDGKVEWNTTRCILPVAYRRICNGNPGFWLAVFFKAWNEIQYSTVANMAGYFTTRQYFGQPSSHLDKVFTFLHSYKNRPILFDFLKFVTFSQYR